MNIFKSEIASPKEKATKIANNLVFANQDGKIPTVDFAGILGLSEKELSSFKVHNLVANDSNPELMPEINDLIILNNNKSSSNQIYDIVNNVIIDNELVATKPENNNGLNEIIISSQISYLTSDDSIKNEKPAIDSELLKNDKQATGAIKDIISDVKLKDFINSEPVNTKENPKVEIVKDFIDKNNENTTLTISKEEIALSKNNSKIENKEKIDLSSLKVSEYTKNSFKKYSESAANYEKTSSISSDVSSISKEKLPIKPEAVIGSKDNLQGHLGTNETTVTHNNFSIPKVDNGSPANILSQVTNKNVVDVSNSFKSDVSQKTVISEGIAVNKISPNTSSNGNDVSSDAKDLINSKDGSKQNVSKLEVNIDSKNIKIGDKISSAELKSELGKLSDGNVKVDVIVSNKISTSNESKPTILINEELSKNASKDLPKIELPKENLNEKVKGVVNLDKKEVSEIKPVNVNSIEKLKFGEVTSKGDFIAKPQLPDEAKTYSTIGKLIEKIGTKPQESAGKTEKVAEVKLPTPKESLVEKVEVKQQESVGKTVKIVDAKLPTSKESLVEKVEVKPQEIVGKTEKVAEVKLPTPKESLVEKIETKPQESVGKSEKVAEVKPAISRESLVEKIETKPQENVGKSEKAAEAKPAISRESLVEKIEVKSDVNIVKTEKLSDKTLLNNEKDSKAAPETISNTTENSTSDVKDKSKNNITNVDKSRISQANNSVHKQDIPKSETNFNLESSKKDNSDQNRAFIPALGTRGAQLSSIMLNNNNQQNSNYSPSELLSPISSFLNSNPLETISESPKIADKSDEKQINPNNIEMRNSSLASSSSTEKSQIIKANNEENLVPKVSDKNLQQNGNDFNQNNSKQNNNGGDNYTPTHLIDKASEQIQPDEITKKASNSFVKTLENIQTRTQSQSEKVQSKPDMPTYMTFTRVKPGNISNIVSDIIGNTGGNYVGTAKLMLTPKSLGTIFVEINVSENSVKLNIKADNRDTVKAIETSLSNLRDKIESQGMKIDNVVVNHYTGEQKKDASAQRDRNNETNRKSKPGIFDMDTILSQPELADKSTSRKTLKYQHGNYVEKYI